LGLCRFFLFSHGEGFLDVLKKLELLKFKERLTVVSAWKGILICDFLTKFAREESLKL
jgi:hypothetical protein